MASGPGKRIAGRTGVDLAVSVRINAVGLLDGPPRTGPGIEVLDTGQGLLAAAKAPRRDGGGVGLQNIRDRLRSTYGPRAELRLGHGPEGSGTLASLHLPLQR